MKDGGDGRPSVTTENTSGPELSQQSAGRSGLPVIVIRVSRAVAQSIELVLGYMPPAQPFLIISLVPF